MSTYNGEEFIQDQLDSIFHQSGVNIHLLVRDDGSTDNTLSILNQYKTANVSKIDIVVGENIGWKKSFHTLIQVAASKDMKYDFYSFADQDDIWLPEKLCRAISKLDALPTGPKLYCSNQILYRNGQECGLVFKGSRSSTKKSCLVCNYATGCTVVFNAALLKYLGLDRPHLPIAHDYWCYMVATLCGAVVIDSNAYILYRQHPNNQVGAEKKWIDLWKYRLKSLRDLMGNHNREKNAREILRIYEQDMPTDAKDALYKLINYRQSLKNRLSLLFDNGYTFHRVSNDFWVKLRIILGRV